MLGWKLGRVKAAGYRQFNGLPSEVL